MSLAPRFSDPSLALHLHPRAPAILPPPPPRARAPFARACPRRGSPARSRTMRLLHRHARHERWTLPFNPVDPRRTPLGITERWILPIVPETAAAKSVREEGGGVRSARAERVALDARGGRAFGKTREHVPRRRRERGARGWPRRVAELRRECGGRFFTRASPEKSAFSRKSLGLASVPGHCQSRRSRAHTMTFVMVSSPVTPVLRGARDDARGTSRRIDSLVPSPRASPRATRRNEDVRIARHVPGPATTAPTVRRGVETRASSAGAAWSSPRGRGSRSVFVLQPGDRGVPGRLGNARAKVRTKTARWMWR